MNWRRYLEMRDYLNTNYCKDYEYLRKDYEDLRKDYEDLRYPFKLQLGITDVWDVNFYNENVFDFPFENYAPVDGFFSLFAFNSMNPYDTLLDRLIPSLKQGGKMIIIDGNTRSIYNRFVASRRRSGMPSPIIMQKKLKALGCRILLIESHCAIPPFV